jgi:hypothetical protein
MFAQSPLHLPSQHVSMLRVGYGAFERRCRRFISSQRATPSVLMKRHCCDETPQAILLQRHASTSKREMKGPRRDESP